MNAAEHLQSIKEFGPAYDIDMVLIGFFINDIERDAEGRPPRLWLLPYRLHAPLSEISYVYWYSYSSLDALYDSNRSTDYRLFYSSETSDHWQRFAGIWNEILDTCRANNWPVVVALLPWLVQLDENYPFSDVHRRVKALSESQGALVVDLFLAVRGYRADDLHVGRTDQHPNDKAHDLFAGELFRALTTSGFLQRVSSPAEQGRPRSGGRP